MLRAELMGFDRSMVQAMAMMTVLKNSSLIAQLDTS